VVRARHKATNSATTARRNSAKPRAPFVLWRAIGDGRIVRTRANPHRSSLKDCARARSRSGWSRRGRAAWVRVVFARLREHGASPISDHHALAVNSDNPRIMAIDEIFRACDDKVRDEAHPPACVGHGWSLMAAVVRGLGVGPKPRRVSRPTPRFLCAFAQVLIAEPRLVPALSLFRGNELPRVYQPVFFL